VQKLGEDSHFYRKERFGKERIDIIEKFHNPNLPKRLLDIGCSTGFVIEEAKDRGWETIGIELNPSAAQFARSRSLTIIEEPLEQANFQQFFSAITLYDVLEHFARPGRIMKRVWDLLLPGGCCIIYVPNYNSASRELLGEENAHFIWPTHHLTYFTPDTLKHFLESEGFKVFFWETQGLDLYDWNWYLNEKTNYDTKLLEKNIESLQFYINASGHGKNLRMYAKKEK
jgi:2-polyprenyl-3-methyl-5-hydroxy-6-metoxy-1,4-benzoquinol methylase